jgi:transposase InsO family protein
MKERKPLLGLGKICWLLGVTRQAYYQYQYQALDVSLEHELVLKEVASIRKLHPRLGTRKLYVKLEAFMLDHQIKMGRDALFNVLSANNLLVRRRKRGVKTTQSHHWLKKYPNLIRSYVPLYPNTLYVSDITYWKIESGYVYISLITDAYSHKIVGYHVAETLEAIQSVEALKMALKNIENGAALIHHSDRGVQYCSEQYIKLLNQYNVKISMTESGDPLDNAIAERVNGILKGEYLECYEVKNIQEAKVLLAQVIKLYNEQRPHMSIGNLVPESVHQNINVKGDRKWKNYYQKKTSVN